MTLGDIGASVLLTPSLSSERAQKMVEPKNGGQRKKHLGLSRAESGKSGDASSAVAHLSRWHHVHYARIGI